MAFDPLTAIGLPTRKQGEILARRYCALSLAYLSCAVSACTRIESMQAADGNAERGKAVVARYGCAACHTIPGIAPSGANVGPPLNSMAKRSYIAGVLANTPEAMVRWLRDPPQQDPRTAMPDLGVSEADAKDIAAYLYTLE